MTQLDHQIQNAVATLNRSDAGTFDMDAYIRAFETSAQRKADDVLAQLQTSRVEGLQPVYVSIGGGNGAELKQLLTRGSGTHGILIEGARALADAARAMQSTLPAGKSIAVYEGDAQTLVSSAMDAAFDTVRRGDAQCVVVTCHAVIHELYDRGRDRFDALQFFAQIFREPSIPTWFSYREPGVPDKWPETVLVSADCSPESLRLLAEAIRQRHPQLSQLSPVPIVVGDKLRLHRTLAMELLAKLFYLGDLQHEINERSTSVNHNDLINCLALSIGDNAILKRNGECRSMSAATDSFVACWHDCRVDVRGLDAQSHSSFLGVPESQTRVIAWRIPDGFTAARRSEVAVLPDDTLATSDLQVAAESLSTGEIELLTSLLVSRGRAWIESNRQVEATELLDKVSISSGLPQELVLWAKYLVAIRQYFVDHSHRAEIFEESNDTAAVAAGLGALFRAERMEAARKTGELERAISLANQLRSEGVTAGGTVLDRYVKGTSRYLLANLLRYGGQYAVALDLIVEAEAILVPTIPSHATELAHCHYARQVCLALIGQADFQGPPNRSTFQTQLFAGALLQLTYSHAAWYIDRSEEAIRFAASAMTQFQRIGLTRYVRRAAELKSLLRSWQLLKAGQSLAAAEIEPELARALSFLVSPNEDAVEAIWFSAWFARQRPSKALGLLQFSLGSPKWEMPLSIAMPKTIVLGNTGEPWTWSGACEVRSMAEADRLLRESMGISLGRRVPLVAD